MATQNLRNAGGLGDALGQSVTLPKRTDGIIDNMKDVILEILRK